MQIIERVSLWQFYVLQGGINSLCSAQISVRCTKGGFFQFKLLKKRDNPALHKPWPGVGFCETTSNNTQGADAVPCD
jgi:hypothetical protein